MNSLISLISYLWISGNAENYERLYSPLFIESQVCPKCFKNFSPEIVLSKHLLICRGLYQSFEGLEAEIDFYRSFLEDDYDEEYIDEPIDF